MTTVWQRWLVVWCWLVILFGLVLAGAGLEATSAGTRMVYGLVGPGDALTFDPTLRFSIALMGAVSIGWGATLLAVALAGRALAAEENRRLWRGITIAVIAWFVIDSALSVATGFPLNAVSNVILLIGYLIAMRGLRVFG